jgi:hypothetical protein
MAAIRPDVRIFSLLGGYSKLEFMPQLQIELESDERFPSGEWMGFYIFGGKKYLMELDLTFTSGSFRGDGRDSLGQFVIAGRYELETGKVIFEKHYVGKHTILYKGWNEGNGIWGTWGVTASHKGGFHIWPRDMADSLGLKLRVEVPVERPVLSG